MIPQNKQYRSNFIITDFYTNFDQITQKPHKKQPWLCRVLNKLQMLDPLVWAVLFLLSVLSSGLCFCVNALCHLLLEFRLNLPVLEPWYWNLVAWVCFSVIFGVLAGCCGKWISSEAEGSGIPEMKSILSGVHLSKHLNYKVLTAKFLGLVLATAAGLSIGNEGPFVHVSGIIANKVMKCSAFSELHNNKNLRKQILAASVGAGIAVAFGAPLGAAFFSIEVTATYYIVNHLWRGIYCAVICVVCFQLFELTKIIDLVDSTSFPDFKFTFELFNFLVLGMACGVMGFLFVCLAGKAVLLRVQNKFGVLHSRFFYILAVTSICAAVTFFLPYLRHPDKTVINHMFSSLDSDTSFWVYFCVKLCLTALSISLPVACGVFTPVFAAGACFGRFFGEVVSSLVEVQNQRIYSIVAAAALTSAVTQTVSVAIIVFELSGQINFLLPMLVGVMSAYLTSRGLGKSIYDVLMEIKRLPYLPFVKQENFYRLKAKDIVSPNFIWLYQTTSVFEVARTVLEAESFMLKVPVLSGSMELLGDLSIAELKNYLYKVYTIESFLLSERARVILDKCFISPSQLCLAENYQAIISSQDTSLEEFFNKETSFTETDPGPLAIPENTPLVKVHFLFLMLGPTQIYVEYKGKLKGILFRANIIGQNCNKNASIWK